MDDFNEIVAHHRTGNNDFDLQKEEHTNHMKTGKGKEKERDNDRVLEKESERNKGQNHEKDRKKERNKSTTRSKESNQRSRDMSKKNASPFSSKVELINKPISELDLSDCERCTPSYCMLPKNYQKPVARYCTDLAKQVLNDSWVSVTSGSEDYSFKHMQKNRYEEALFNCEDDRYEFDMLIESTASTIQDIQELLEKIHDNTIERNGHIKIEEHLSAISLRCIESLYGDHGLDLIDELCKNPCRGLPIIQKRLQQKHGEWCKCRAMWNKIWADVYAKNYHGSLDCRNLHVSQNDRKSLSKKALLQDIREISARKSREDGGILTFAAGYSTPFIPHLKSKYPDPALHEDLYKIIKYSSNEVCTTTEESDQVMRVWTIFLEDMLGFPLQSNGGEDLEELVEFRNCNAKKIDSFVAGTSSNISKSSHGLAEEINSKAESEREVEEMANKHSEDFLASSDCFAVMAKPLIEHVDSTTLRNTSDTNYVFYGNDAFYVLLRLYQSLYEQILFAKENALAAEKNWKSGKDTPTPKLYSKIMDLLYSLLDGSSDNSEFEYECRAITGKSYMMFMLDKLIFKLVKQLQTIALGEMENNLLNLGLYERWRSPSNFSDVVYHANAYKLLNGENIYRFEFASHSAELSIQLMEWGPEKLGVDAKALEPAFSDYLYNNLFSTVRDEKERHQIFLSRNMRKYGSVDESYSISKKMKGVTIVNGLLQTISCNTSKVKCVMGTEDLVFRKKIKQ